MLMTGASIRQTLVKIAIFSSGRGNCARSSPDRCTKTSKLVVTSTTAVLVALGAQMLVNAKAALMIHVGWSSVCLKMAISGSMKPRRDSSDADWLLTAWKSAHRAFPRVFFVVFGASSLERIASRNTSI